MIVSIPHTGTRSLMKYLGQDKHLHIGINDQGILALTEPVDVPIRDPYAVSITWEATYPGEPEKVGRELVLWDLLIKYVKSRDGITFHITETLPIRDGIGPDHPARHDPAIANDLLRIRWLKDWIQKPERMEFFQQFYPRFEWL